MIFRGFAIFPDLYELDELTPDTLSEFDQFPIEASVTEESPGQYLFLCDLPTLGNSWGGTFRCRLYKVDGRVLGQFKYLTEANLADDMIDGEYDMAENHDDVAIRAKVIHNGQPRYGLFFYLERPEGS